MELYTKSELFDLWKGFKGQHDEIRMMMDFALCSKDKAKELIQEFQAASRK